MDKENMSRRSFLALSAVTTASLVLDWSKINALAAGMGNKANYPVVVIGAGLGGLSAAAYLAKFGVPVTLVEQHTIPGGYATAFERGDFTFDVSLHQISVNNNSTAAILKELGVLDTLQFVPLPGQQDGEQFAESLCRQFPSEKDGIKGFVQEIAGIWNEVSDFAKKGGNFRKASLVHYPKIANMQDKTLADLLGAYVKDPALKDLLATGWGACGLPPSTLSALFFAVARGSALKYGSSYIRPRSQALSNALAEVIVRSGGKIMYGTAVKSIKVKGNAVTGVELQDGKTLPAVAVVSNAGAPTTFRKMLPPGSVPSHYMNKVDRGSISISTFMVWLGLNKDAREIMKTYRARFATGRGIEADYLSCVKGNIGQMPYSITLYDHLFEGYSKPGKSTVTLLCLSGYEPWRRFESDYDAGRKTDYHKEKERWTKTLVARAEKDCIPGLGRMIEVMDSATPLTNRHFTRNPEGAIYGFNQTVDNTFTNRLDAGTPIKGLYIASAWGIPGGGYGSVLTSGKRAFKAIVENWQG